MDGETVYRITEFGREMLMAKWIQKAIKKPGALRRSLGAKKGKPIPVSKLRRAAKAGGTLGRRARLALTLRKLRKRRH